MGVGLGLAALVLASLIAWKSIGPDWLAERLAAVIALCGVVAVAGGTGLAGLATKWSGKAVAWLAKLAGAADPKLVTPVTDWTIPIIVGVVGLLWLAAMVTPRAAKYVGGIANHSFSPGLMWGGAIVLGLYSGSGPGQWGVFLASVVTNTTDFGNQLVSAVL